MSVTRLRTTEMTAARNIARALFPTEASIDKSIIDAANLVSSIVAGRLETGAPLEKGHEAVDAAIRSLSLLGEARTHALKCHNDLTIVRDHAGLSPDELGCSGGKITQKRRDAKAA